VSIGEKREKEEGKIWWMLLVMMRGKEAMVERRS